MRVALERRRGDIVAIRTTEKQVSRRPCPSLSLSAWGRSLRRRRLSSPRRACAGLAQLVKFGVECCCRFLGDVLQLAEQVLVRFAVAVNKPALRTAVLPALSDGIGEPLTDFDRAGFVGIAP